MTPSDETFSAEERAAMKEAAAEKRTAAKRAKDADKAAAELQDVIDKIATFSDFDRPLAEKVHEIVTTVAPQLAPKLWYGMPSYANAEGKSVLFFKDAAKFKDHYATLGFQATAHLDEGTFWAKEFAITAIDDAVAAQIAELVRRAVS
ncbi:MAG: hypothetical protein CMH36_12910 [Microbacterium sp.]|jgi:uncharacterized protein YdhG (YjbR/CyaY superfamily)|uniref:DUF1801 domain-containing protein n=2 Tax=Bacteria TaxID=2 RepID=A0A0F0LSB9_9MICO|nr:MULTISPECIES: DUF1801 domain-containing protein [Microbacterium]MAL07706.1 hypothetical protein [Microbacterium sp.]MCK9916670.1 DUF1801 domain-containing protein [Microbacteriaceae bacterium K1510]KJL36028.1 hypothetical protein RR49_02075 [Microbacterium ginsengisoli]MBN9208497.1 DUF1801 domain-containing protein [Microbacterium ginsengisoli]ODU77023.1 MAG: hypothetical protein ABT08_07670 [Microbacterium sp. SCN 71-21]